MIKKIDFFLLKKRHLKFILLETDIVTKPPFKDIKLGRKIKSNDTET